MTQSTTELRAILEAMSPSERKGALAALDAVSRPLTPKEIEGQLRYRGCSKSQATKLASALRPLRIIAVVGGEDA